MLPMLRVSVPETRGVYPRAEFTAKRGDRAQPMSYKSRASLIPLNCQRSRG
jgi:hypothetical protein